MEVTTEQNNPRAERYLSELMERADPDHERLKAYYRNRGLSPTIADNLAYVEEEKYYNEHEGSIVLPAMIALFQDPEGELVGVFRTYLDPDSDGKADVNEPKKCFAIIRKGATIGAAVRLHEAGEVLGIAEGIETAEAVHQATEVPTWATCAANRMAKVVLPEFVREVHIWADRDPDGAGQSSSMEVAQRLLAEGRRVKLLLPTEVGKDWLDELVEHGSQKLQSALDEAPLLAPEDLAENLPAVVERVPTVTAGGLLRTDDPVPELNKKHCVVTVGGKTHVGNEVRDPESGNIRMELGSPKDFAVRYANWLVSDDKGNKTIPAAQVWMTSTERREYEGIVFAPGKDGSGYYNLWRGFAVEPRQGDCSLFWDHVREVICGSDDVHYTYVKKWLAHMVQRPAELPEVAIVIRGKQGVGKGAFVEPLGLLAGQHFMELSRMEQVTGRFNSHLADCLLVYANEAVWGGDKQNEGSLKTMVTDYWFTVEGKGKDIYKVRNYKRLIVSSNEEWAVPLGLDDRRFLVLEASDSQKENKEYFRALKSQLRNGGLEALLYDLQNENLEDFEVRTMPRSRYGFDMKLRSASPMDRWWHEVLQEGTLGFRADEFDDPGDWEREPHKDAVYRRFLDYCKTHNLRTIGKSHFGKRMFQLLPGGALQQTRPAADGSRKRRYVFPTLQECREVFQALTSSGPEIWGPSMDQVVNEESDGPGRSGDGPGTQTSQSHTAQGPDQADQDDQAT